MIRWFIATMVLLLGISEVTSPTPTLTPAEIFAKNKDAMVHIFANNSLSGCGFIVSSDGLVVTANHVITTTESNFTEPFTEIEVVVGQRSHVATVVNSSKTGDTAILRIIADDLPHVTIGDMKSVKPADAAIMITFLPDSHASLPLLVTGSVSGVGAIGQTSATILQMPIRKGFSGSPIFNESGHVIGIISTRLIGISPDLEVARNQLKEGQVIVRVGSADIAKTLLGLINSLDADLVSGLGSAVDISYAKQMLEDAKKNEKK